MGMNNVVFLEVIEWHDDSGDEMVHRIPETGSGEIKWGAQLTVRESQAAVMFYQGRAYDVFDPGQHTLVTGNIPILTKILSLPWGFTSPLRAEVCFVNMKTFADLRWGTRDPVAFKDSELGLIRLRAFGMFNVRIVQPVLFVNALAGTKGVYRTGEIAEYLGRVVVSRLNDQLGETLDSILNLPGRYDEMAENLTARLYADFAHFGLELQGLFINSITPPTEVQQAIDDRARVSAVGDLDKFLKMKTAMALEKAAAGSGEAASGFGLGLGMMLPGLFAGMNAGGERPALSVCTGCRGEIPAEARFCPRCGQQQIILRQCESCGRNLAADAKFCPGCGRPANSQPTQRRCPHCGALNLKDSVFCNGCGERL